MNSIAQTNQSEKQLSEKMQSFLSRYHVGRLLRSANAYKLRGFPVLSVFLVAFSTAFTQRSFFMQMSLQSRSSPTGSACSHSAGRMEIHSYLSATRFFPPGIHLLAAASKKVDARSNGAKQRRLAQMKATEVMLRLLQEAKEAAIPARHVLFDTWFCSPSSLLSIHALGYEVVAMAKKTEKIHYLQQELSALGEGLPRTLVRCHDGACIRCVSTVHVSGCGAT